MNLECEVNCRSQFINELKTNYKKVTKQELDDDIKAALSDRSINQYDLGYDKKLGDVICNQYLKGAHPSPGKSLALVQRSGKRAQDFNKEVGLGNICCQESNSYCKCEIEYKTGNNAAFIPLDKQMLEVFKRRNNYTSVEDAASRVFESYDCSKETQNCVDDCKRAAGIYFESSTIANESLALSSMDILYNLKTALDTCYKVTQRIFNQKVYSPGVDVYLKYQVGDKTQYPNAEKVKLGNLCCYEYQNFTHFAYYKCDPTWQSSIINFKFELLQWRPPNV